MHDKRAHPRVPLSVKLKIWHPDIGEMALLTKNFSEGGLFVVVDPEGLPSVGEIVQGQVQDTGGEMPIIKMRIVRVEEDGWGLEDVNESSHSDNV
ncbi:MAG TPA: PilZ domain-containing protein [Marinagarivorans sp.]